MINRVFQYGDIREQIRSGDVLLYKGRGFISWLVKQFTGAEYSHAGFAVWWNKRLMVMEAVGKGVVVTPLSRNIELYHGDVEWYWCKKNIAPADRVRMVQFAQEELGKCFARWKMFAISFYILFKRDMDKRDELRRANRLFCSYYVSQVYNSIGLDLKKNKSDRFMSPNDVAQSPLLVKRAVLKKEP
ncbi:MAG: YiiX/YebB-like N1pC/P60 family cysteine hydrolase [Nitrospirota bacterium]